MCEKNNNSVGSDKVGMKSLDTPICIKCHFGGKVVRNTVKETIAAQKMELHGWKTPEWLCCRCGHTFD